MRGRGLVAFALVALAAPAAAQDKTPPYWASIASGQAMMRTGPARNYPGIWLYQRRDLPVRVLKVFPNWRLIEDPDGAKGWMLVTLLSDRRTGMVKKGEPRKVRVSPSGGAKVRYLAQPGVVGRIDQCDGRFCRFEISGKRGFIAQADIYGLSPNEVID